MYDYITTVHFARAKEEVKIHEDTIRECINYFNNQSRHSANYKQINQIEFLDNYNFQLRWVSANPINTLQAGRALRLFSDRLLKENGMKEKLVGGKFLAYSTTSLNDYSPEAAALELIGKIIQIVRNDPADERIKKIEEIVG